MAIHVDLETRSEVDLRTAGAWKYACAPSTEVLVVCAAREDGPVLEGQDAVDLVGEDPAEEVWAHNAAFELALWRHVVTRQWGAPEVDARRWRCTMALAAASGLPLDLGGAARALGLEAEKDQEGRRLMLRLAKRVPRPAESLFAEDLDDTPSREDLARLTEYCRQDVVVERALHGALPPLSAAELGVWRADQAINLRGMAADLELCRAAAERSKALDWELHCELREITRDAVSSGRAVTQMVRWLESRGQRVLDLRRETVADLLEHADHFSLPSDVRRVLEIRQELAGTARTKYAAALAMAEGGRIRGCLQYHGAHTGRWSGRGFQPQNLVRCAWEPQAQEDARDALVGGACAGADALGYMVRGAIVAEPGHRFLVGDWSAIEARVLLWLAGDPGLRLFRTRDADPTAVEPYVYMGARLPAPREPAELQSAVAAGDLDAKARRDLGKSLVLGCGFGMGWRKFEDHAGVGRAQAIAAVREYRATFPDVPRLWDELEAGVMAAVRAPAGTPPIVMAGGRLRAGAWRGCLALELPSGRRLIYREPQIGPHTITYETEEGRQERVTKASLRFRHGRSVGWTWGGTLVENAVQAIARDLLAAALVRCEERGLRVVLHAHDEIVAEVPLEGGLRLEHLLTTMQEVPPWAAGLPLAAEGWAGTRYRKG